MLVKGIGMKKAKAILERCESLGNLSTVCSNDDRALRDFPGIGPILAARIKEALWACEKPIEA
jgi:Holliday junction resolvasome RuvABC DNA-binding subunit